MSVQDRSFERFQTQKTGALLAYLSLQPGRSQSREMMAETLWPEGDPTSIRNRLNQAVSSLRRQLHPPECPGLVLVADHFTLKVNDQMVVTDVQQFLAALSSAEHSKDRNDKLFHLLTAINLYQGDLLAGYFEEWVLPQRLNFSDKYASALREVVRIYSRIGEPEMGIRYCTKLLELEPNDVRTHLDLIDLYDRADRAVSAVRQYDQMARMLVLAGEPLPEEARLLKKRVERSLSSATTPTLPKASATPTATPVVPAKPKAAPADNLPHEISRFIGRGNELNAIEKGVASGCRLITLTGLSGMGKTRLALAAADQLRSKFERRLMVAVNGRSFMPEAAGDVLSHLIGTVVDSADISVEAHRAALSSLPPTFLILDGIEPGNVGVSEFVGEVLKSAPNLTMMITTGMPLLITGGMEVPVGPLPLPMVSDSIADLAANPAVALFTDRAQSVKSDFQLTGRTSTAVAKMVTELEGIPLALELAAVWARTMSATQISESLSNRFDFLSTVRPEVPARHRSLLQSLDESYRVLTKPQKDAFQRLAVIEGTYSLDFARLVLEVDHAQRILDGLVATSFITSVTTPMGTRYRTLETLSEFAKQAQGQIAVETAATVIIDSLRTYLPSHPEEVPFLYPNVPVALEFLDNNGRQSEALELAVSLGEYWQYQDHLTDGISWLRRLIGNAENPSIAAETLLARLEWVNGDYVSAGQRFESIVANGSALETGDARLGLIGEYHRVGRFQEVESHCRTIIAADDSSVANQVNGYLRLGNCMVDQLRLDEAQAAYEQALYLARTHELRTLQGSALQGLACLAMENHHYEAASRWMSESLEALQEVSPSWRLGLAYVDQARLSVIRGRPSDALSYLDTATKLSMGADLVVWRIAYASALALLDLGDFTSAAQLLGFTEDRVQRGGHALEARDLVDFRENVQRCDREFGTHLTREYMILGRNLEATAAMDIVTRLREVPSVKESASNRRNSKIGIAA